MSLRDRRRNSLTEQQVDVKPHQMPDFVAQLSPVEQLPFPDTSALSGEDTQNPQFSIMPDITRSPFEPITSPGAMRQLTEVQTGTLSTITKSATTTLRQPLVIRGSHKKRVGKTRPPIGRRLVVHMAVTILLVFIVFGALISVIPTGNDGHNTSFNLFSPILNQINSKSHNTGLIAQQAATATAVTQDGFDAGAGGYAGIPSAPAGTGAGLNRFFYGQCTYWANMHYHDLTGVWVPWLGNANQWTSGAYNNGWVVSGTPKVYSIIVLQAGVQGAGYYGHVAVVEHINSDGSVLTSNWNWAGNWGRTTYVTFSPGSGVSFIWAPGH